MADEFAKIIAEPTGSADEVKSAKEELEFLAEKSEHKRSEKLRDAVSKHMVWSVSFLWLLACIMVVVIAWHHIGSESYKWIEPDTLSTLTKFFLGSVVGFFASYTRKRLD